MLGFESCDQLRKTSKSDLQRGSVVTDIWTFQPFATISIYAKVIYIYIYIYIYALIDTCIDTWIDTYIFGMKFLLDLFTRITKLSLKVAPIISSYDPRFSKLSTISPSRIFQLRRLSVWSLWVAFVSVQGCLACSRCGPSGSWRRSILHWDRPIRARVSFRITLYCQLTLSN